MCRWPLVSIYFPNFIHSSAGDEQNKNVFVHNQPVWRAHLTKSLLIYVASHARHASRNSHEQHKCFPNIIHVNIMPKEKKSNCIHMGFVRVLFMTHASDWDFLCICMFRDKITEVAVWCSQLKKKFYFVIIIRAK